MDKERVLTPFGWHPLLLVIWSRRNLRWYIGRIISKDAIQVTTWSDSRLAVQFPATLCVFLCICVDGKEVSRDRK